MWFNFAEACAWFLIGFHVLGYWIRNRKTPYEVLYFLSFAAFGITDLLEMDRLTAGLLSAKLVCILAIFSCRKVVIERYPGRRL